MPLVTGTVADNPACRALGLIRSLRLDLDHGPWVAGGAARRLLSPPQKPNIFDGTSDIDVFVRNKAQGYRVMADLSVHTPDRRGSSTHWCAPGYPAAEVVMKTVFPSLDDLLASFDFTICMIATDGFRWAADPRFLADEAAKRLVPNPSRSLPLHPARLIKYCAHGYTPSPGLMTETFRLRDPDVLSRFHGGVLIASNDVFY